MARDKTNRDNNGVEWYAVKDWGPKRSGLMCFRIVPSMDQAKNLQAELTASCKRVFCVEEFVPRFGWSGASLAKRN